MTRDSRIVNQHEFFFCVCSLYTVVSLDTEDDTCFIRNGQGIYKWNQQGFDISTSFRTLNYPNGRVLVSYEAWKFPRKSRKSTSSIPINSPAGVNLGRRMEFLEPWPKLPRILSKPTNS